jgi:polar amino acid transport system permease protein
MSYSPEQFVHPPTGRPGKTERDNELESFIDFAINSLPALLKGTLVTLELWVICIFWGTLLGLFLSLCRVYGRGAVYIASTAYIELIRGTPQLVQMFIIYLGLPDIGIVLRPIVAASISIALNTAAYQAEYFRGAILSVEPGQMAAARSLGMSKLKAVRKIILPQALRLAIPQWSNEVILELKMTSIAFAIGVSELMAQAKAIGFRTFRYIEIFMLAAIIYLIIVSFFSTLLDIAERKLKIPGLEIG